MSRLGAAGAVLPLITDGQAEVLYLYFLTLMHLCHLL